MIDIDDWVWSSISSYNYMPKIGYYYNSITIVDIGPIREEKKDVVAYYICCSLGKSTRGKVPLAIVNGAHDR